MLSVGKLFSSEFMKIRKSPGPRVDPCLHPDVILRALDSSFLTLHWNSLPVSQSPIQLNASPLIPALLTSSSSISCFSTLHLAHPIECLMDVYFSHSVYTNYYKRYCL